MNQRLIEFKDVTKKYIVGEITIDALKLVNFSIDEGEFVVVLGASGAGKSTILNILGGMDSPTSGQIIVENKDITKLNEKNLTEYRGEKIGFVFQFYNLIHNLTALENVEFALEVKKDYLNPKEVLNKVGLSERLNNFPSQLSGGEQQRVAIARAVAKNPLLLLCDEPTGALDYNTGKSVLELLENLNKEMGKCIVLITHNEAIAKMADKIIRIKSGKVEKVMSNDNKLSVKEIEW